jgi:hypothetical protein
MSVRCADGVVVLEGDCQVDEAEQLLEFLLANPSAEVDWSDCGQLHTALIQVLLAVRPKMRGSPEVEFLNRWIAPIFNYQ